MRARRSPSAPPHDVGMTLVELLVATAIMGVLMLAFTQVFGGSLRASGEISARNELLSEAQIAQQYLAAKLQNAFYVYPSGTPIQLSQSGVTTQNTVRSGAGQGWRVATDPFIAMLLPPTSRGLCPANTASTSVKNANRQFCFTLHAFYPVHRGTLVRSGLASVPPPDPQNEDVWVLMEYRANLFDGVDRTLDQLAHPPLDRPDLYRGRSAQMLADYVQPSTQPPRYTMFSTDEQGGTVYSVAFELRMLQNRVGKALMAPAGAPPLSTRVYPRNVP
jgi:prepilin-type N-terminal cleavage/methylation domain-containing protein